MTKNEMQTELRKMLRKVAGNKNEFARRLENVVETNDRGMATTGEPCFTGIGMGPNKMCYEQGAYLAVAHSANSNKSSSSADSD